MKSSIRVWLIILLQLHGIQAVAQAETTPFRPTWNTENLKGAVKTIEEKGFLAVPINGGYKPGAPGWPTSWENDSKRYFDTLGNLLKKDFFKSGKLVRTEQFRYEDTLLVEIQMRYHHHRLEYDTTGKIHTEYYQKKQPTTLRTGTEPPVSNAAWIKITYRYDHAGNLIAKLHHNPNTLEKAVDSIFYDQKNRPIVIRSYFGSFVEFEQFEYNEHDQLSKFTYGEQAEGPYEITSYYYANNQLVREVCAFYDEGEYAGDLIYVFENGNEIACTEREPDGREATTIYRYVFDDRGNWTQKTIIDQTTKKAYLIQRTIVYH